MSDLRIVVGYTANESGADALALANRVASAAEGVLEVVMVLPSEAHNARVPVDQGYLRYLREQSREWLTEASTHLGADVASKLHIRYAESFAEGLIDAAHEFDANLIVVGAAGGGRRAHARVGSVANELLHSSDVPVALAPPGAREITAGLGVTRITACIGTRPGADEQLEAATALARATRAPLRLLSLVPIDLPAGLDTHLAELTSSTHAEQVLHDAHRALPDGIEATVEIARGSTIEDAVHALDWHDGELVLVGSSRLAAPRRLFLGSTAAKVLRELPVPMIVVPRTTHGKTSQ
ncbi:nucleotide-binding universal stress UspA family protein [Agromyces flavus]|uniref:Nucleotide-binding universal stress UspA family protein n=1 Tax=Agromyces flavus TaxID=589382 RepID=A0A1H1XII2_9MICO|nr:universal stress protein [Agromyces flavus]MCP2366413.1 nucleotide-binding universal stress UspA family protein [Agromyces flavus]GGI44628.1 universal stress protein UspA [Agromyces flavus]SDT08526.1 Nucleotide-binding universal stress protein, UspA family [Agromyces flavus]